MVAIITDKKNLILAIILVVVVEALVVINDHGYDIDSVHGVHGGQGVHRGQGRWLGLIND